MDAQMLSICNLKNMEVIDINTGAKIGFIKDFKINCENFKIISIILPSLKVSLFNKGNFLEIPWDRVRKIGVDVILIDGNEILLGYNE